MKRLLSFLLLTLTIMFATVNTMQANAMSADTPDANDYLAYNITATGNYNLTMNLSSGMLTTEANAEEGLYIIGTAAGGWNGEYIKMTKSSTGNIYTYTGTLKGGEMKFATLLGSDSKAIYGNNNLCATSANLDINASLAATTPVNTFSLQAYTSGDNKFKVAEGYYSITVDKDNMTLTVNDYKAKGLYLITSFNDDGSVNWSNATAMTQDSNGKYTTSSDITVANSGKLMFAEIYGDNSTLWGSEIEEPTLIPQLITPKTHTITNSAMTTARAFNTVAGLLNITVDITSTTQTLTVNHFYPDVLYVEGLVNGTDGWTDKTLSVAITRGDNGTYHVEHAFVTGDMKFAVNNLTFGEGDWVAATTTVLNWPTTKKAYTDTNIEYAITPYTDAASDLKFNLQSGYYDFTVDLANKKVILKLYNPNSIVLYGVPTGQGEPRKSDFTFTKKSDDEYNITAHLKAGILRVAKLVDGTPYQLSPKYTRTEDTSTTPSTINKTAVSADVTPASTRQESTVTLSQYDVAVPTTEATAYGYIISGGYYDITVKDFNSSAPYIIFNEVRDNLRVVGEVNQDWSIEIDDKICGTSTTNNKLTPTLNGFEYKGYLHGLEMKFCEQHSKKGEKDEYGRFYTHAWGPMRKSVIARGSNNLPISDNEMGNSYTEIKATGSFDIEDMAAADADINHYDRYDSKFDVYPGYYEFTVNFLTNKLTVSKFVPYQRIVVADNVSSTEGYATFMCAYGMDNAVTSCLYKRASGKSNNPCEGSDNDFNNASNWTQVTSSDVFGFYSCDKVNDQNQLVLTEVTNIAHSTPYIIHATPGTYYLKLPENATIAEKKNRWIYNNWDYEGNDFTPFNNYYASKTTDPYNKYNPCVNTAGILRGNWHMGRQLATNSNKYRYLMQKQDSDGLALYYCKTKTDYTLSPYSCYLELDQPLSSGAKVLKFSFDDEASSAINETPATDNNVKGIYTIDGVKTNTMHKGINIIRMADGSVRKIMNK